MGQPGHRRIAATAKGVTDSSPAIGVLRTIKLVHTVVWAGFAGCIVAIPVLALQERLRPAALLAVRWMGAGP